MIFKLLFITVLCLVSSFAYGTRGLSQSPSFANQFVQKCGARYLTENLSLKTSFLEEEARAISEENEKELPSEGTKTGFFGSLASYAQRGFDSAKQKLQKLPNVLSRQANAIGTRAKNLSNMLTKEASKASKKIGHLSRKVSDGISDLMTTSKKDASSSNVTEIALTLLEVKETSLKENIQENKTLKIENTTTQSQVIMDQQPPQNSVDVTTEIDQKKGVFENLKNSVKGISKATFANMNKIKRKISQTPNEIMSKFPSVKVIPNYISNAMGIKKSTSMLNHLSKRLKQIPQNITKALQGTAFFLKNAVSSNINTISDKIQVVPSTLSTFYQNFTRKVNATTLTKTKDMISKRVQALPDKVGRTFGYLANQTKKASSAFGTKFANLTNTISEGFTKIKQKVNTTTVAKAINMFTSKVANIPAKMGKSFTLVYQSIKNRISSLVTSGAKFVKEKMPSLSEGVEKFASMVGSWFTWMKDVVGKLVFGTFRLVSKVWGFVSSLGGYLYWGLFVILGAIFLYIMSQALPIITFVIKIIQTPLEILSLLISIIRSLLPKKRQNNVIQEKKKPQEKPKKSKSLDNQYYYSYYRCSACKKEWESSNTTENESQACINEDCIQAVIKPYHQIQLLSEKEKPGFSDRQVFFSYYKCTSCKEEWEIPKTLENEAQKCKNSECSREVLPYHQIQLLNNNNIENRS